MDVKQPGPAKQVDLLADAILDQITIGENAFSDTMHCLINSVRTRLNMEVAFVSEFVDDQRIFRFVDSGTGLDIVQVDQGGPLTDSYCQRVADGRLPEVIQDARELPAAQCLPVTRSLPVGAHISVPIRLPNGEIFGTFCSFSRYPDPDLGDRDLAMVRVFADLAGVLIGRHQSEVAGMQKTRARIRSILDQDTLTLVAQPIVELSSGATIGYELLTRVSGPDSLRPDHLFAQAAQVGMSLALETRIVEKACALLNRSEPQGFLTLNLTPEFILNTNLDSLFTPPRLDRLVLEITEHAIIRDYEALRESLAPLRARGARIAIDDTGAGYASLRHILQLMPDIIKLDISLIHNIDSDMERQALASALVSFSRCRHYRLIAEGIEQAGELAILQSLGTDWGQGYYFSRPAPLHTFWN